MTWELGHWTRHSSIGLGFWKLGLRPSSIRNWKLCAFLDLEAGTLDLSFQLWACLFEAGPSAQTSNYVCLWTWKLERWTCHSSIGLFFWMLGRRPSLILHKILCLFLDLGAIELGPAAFLIRNYVCSSLGNWEVVLVTPALDLSFGSWPSFILTKKLCLCLDLEAGAMDLSLQHWTSWAEASFLISNYVCL